MRTDMQMDTRMGMQMGMRTGTRRRISERSHDILNQMPQPARMRAFVGAKVGAWCLLGLSAEAGA